ncbi:hypothetical protein HY384_03045 [Candidatus Daviesbacteria bacterium]|nr:hypothetical protein [Candidatus Daviesbacteria bacterium]
MKNILIILPVFTILVTVFFTASVYGASPSPGITIKSLIPPSSAPAPTPPTTPVTPSPPGPGAPTPPATPSPTTPPPGVPPPPGTPPPPPSLPPPDKPGDVCNNLTVVYQGLGDTSPDLITRYPTRFSIIFSNPQFFNDHKNKIIQRLKLASNYNNAKNKFTLVSAQNRILNAISGPLTIAGSIGIRGLETSPEEVQSIKQKTGITEVGGSSEDEMILNFYHNLYKLVDYGSTRQWAFFTVGQISNVLRSNNLPLLPYLITNRVGVITNLNLPSNDPEIQNIRQFISSIITSDSPGVGTSNFFGSYEGYPLAGNVTEGFAMLQCGVNNPRVLLSGSPLIHTYSPNSLAIKIKPLVGVTFASPNYSLINGFTTKTNSNYLYYEFVKSQELIQRAQSLGRRRIVVRGNNLENIILEKLLPSLNLTNKELKDFIEADIKPQLSKLSALNSHSYEVILLQNSEVDSLIPLEITPIPDTLIRNLIIVKGTSAPTTTYNLKPMNSPRSDLTIVENSFILTL